MRRCVLCFLPLVIALGCARSDTGARPPSVPPVAAGPSWDLLREGLVGRWVATVQGQSLEVSYRATARDTVLLETWMPGTPGETLSVVHLDGDRLVFTHYCGQGNQPRLALVEHSGDRLVFSRFDATDRTADEAALSALTLTVGETTLQRDETYERQGETETTTLVFTRQ